MSDESKHRPVDDAAQPANNPEGDSPKPHSRSNPLYSGNVSGDRAEEAGRRATEDEPVTRREVIDQSAYKDESADPGLQAGSAEQAEEDREEDREE